MTSSSDIHRVAWSTVDPDRLRERQSRTSDALLSLAGRAVELALLVGATRNASDSNASHSSAESRPPLRLDAVAELAEIASLAVDLDVEARAVLGLPRNGTGAALRGTVERLSWLAGVIASVWDADPSTGHTASRRILTRHARAGRVLGLVREAFRISDPCPGCGELSLWVDPDSWSVACGLARCGYSRLLDERPAVHRSESRAVSRE